MGVFQELKRRNVFRVGIAYLVLSWLLLQVADVVVPILELPDWVGKLVLFLLLLGFPLVLFFAWAYELTPDGIKREAEVDRERSITPQTGRKLDRAIIAFLAIAVAMLLVDRFWLGLESEPEATLVESGDDRSVAVLPFVPMSSGPDDEFFADGLTEEILNSLAQLPELLVTARTSAFLFKGKELPVAEIAATLGVRHIVEGSVRRSGDRLRVTAQLVRAEDGFHLWSQNYDRGSEDAITVQEDIAEQIATALDVVLNDEKRDAMQRAGLRDVEAFIEYQKARDLYAGAHGDLEIMPALRRANEHYSNVLQRVPGYGPAYLDRSDIYVHMLLNDATGVPNPGVSSADVEAAYENAINEYANALRFARSQAERNAREFDLAVISGDWRGLRGRAQRVLRDTECVQVHWLSPVASVFGMAEEYLDRAERRLACDPLYSIMYFNRTRAAIWSRQPELAVQIAEQGARIAPTDWVSVNHVRALVAAGRLDDAEEIIASSMKSGLWTTFSRALIASASGNASEIAAAIEVYRADPEAGEFYDLPILAWQGDRDGANRLAAKFDKSPLAYHVLTIVTMWCACGAPFDLEFTPHFAAKIDEAGFPWPPASPITFPLKDW